MQPIAAKTFTKSEWIKIRKKLDVNPAKHGLLDQVYGSVLLASFNIRKLGSASKRNRACMSSKGFGQIRR